MNSNLDSRIESLAATLLAQYEAAEALVTKIERSEKKISDQVELYESLGAALQRIKTTEADLSESKKLVESSGSLLMQPTRDFVDKTIQIVLRLIPRIVELESKAKRHRAEMGPEIHRRLRAKEMQTAYSGQTQS